MSINVLVVDSDEEVQSDVFALLHNRYKDVNIHSVYDGDQAIDYLVTHGAYVDTVLLGTDMPATDGWEALYVLKDQDNWPHIPVVMMIPENNLWDDAMKAHTIGAEHFISKPISAFELLNVLDALLKEKV